VGIIEGQQVVVGRDILLSVQGVPMTSNADMVRVLKDLERLLSMKWTAW